MSDGKWTPGPWKAANHGIVQRNYLDIDGETSTEIVATAAFSIRKSHAEVDANARLIAAAPDLYKALSLLMEWIEKRDASWIIEETQEAADLSRSALARARGEAP